jgi:hypothetical protein
MRATTASAAGTCTTATTASATATATSFSDWRQRKAGQNENRQGGQEEFAE